MKVEYRAELANKVEGAQAGGNLYGVGEFIDGRRVSWLLPPQEDERFAQWLVEVLARPLVDRAEVVALVRGISSTAALGPPWLLDLLAVFGWQGGTWTQALAEVRRLKAIEEDRRRPVIVCLCGSTRFYKAFQHANYLETLAGRIVLSVGFYSHAAERVHGESIHCTPELKQSLNELHKRKIDLADEVLILNVNGYIGEGLRSEIEYARSKSKPIRWLNLELAEPRQEGAPTWSPRSCPHGPPGDVATDSCIGCVRDERDALRRLVFDPVEDSLSLLGAPVDDEERS